VEGLERRLGLGKGHELAPKSMGRVLVGGLEFQKGMELDQWLAP